MSEHCDRRARDFSKYDSMSTEQLQEILRLDAHRTDGVEMDTDELFYIMEVLADRRKNDSTYTGKTVQEAYETFRKHYLPQEETEPVSRKTIVMPSWLRRAAAAAAVLAVLLTVTVSANAFGFDLWGMAAQWSEDFFRFEDETQGTSPSEPNINNELDFSSLQEALDFYNVTLRLAPSWLPDGYLLDEIEVIRSPRETSIFAYYQKGNNELSISVRRLIETTPEDIEKSDNLIEAYPANGVTYYIFSNNSNIQAAWILDEFEGLIIGQISIEEMKAILDSI